MTLLAAYVPSAARSTAKPPPKQKPSTAILPEDITSALIEAQKTAPPETTQQTLAVASTTVRPTQRPSDLIMASASPTEDLQPEVVTRLSTSGGHHWGINVGRYNSRYKAERVLLTTALTEMATLDGTLRKVVQRPQGYDANFLGMTRESADLACRRLQARNVSCFMVGPSS